MVSTEQIWDLDGLEVGSVFELQQNKVSKTNPVDKVVDSAPGFRTVVVNWGFTVVMRSMQ